MLKKPKSPLTDALVGLLVDDARVDTTSVTPRSAWAESGRAIVAACSITGLVRLLALPTLVGVTPNKLRDGTRSHAGIDGIEGMPTDHPLPLDAVDASFVEPEPEATFPRRSATDAEVDGG